MRKEDRMPLGKSGWTSEEALLKQTIEGEGQLQKQITQWLNLKGIFVLQTRFGTKSKMIPGTPDICCVIKRGELNFDVVPMAFEVKFGLGELSDEQRNVMEKMRNNGWQYYVVRSLAQVMEIVRL